MAPHLRRPQPPQTATHTAGLNSPTPLRGSTPTATRAGIRATASDVPPKLAARVRLLDSGQINKNDPNDARSVAVAALRAHELPELAAEDHAMVMRVWARRYHDLARLRTQVVCRLHAVVCELVPGGV